MQYSTETVRLLNQNQLFSQRYMLIKINFLKNISILLNWIIYNVPKDVKKWPRGSKYFMICVNHMTVPLQMKEKIICSNISVCFPDQMSAQINTMKNLTTIICNWNGIKIIIQYNSYYLHVKELDPSFLKIFLVKKSVNVITFWWLDKRYSCLVKVNNSSSFFRQFCVWFLSHTENQLMFAHKCPMLLFYGLTPV